MDAPHTKIEAVDPLAGTQTTLKQAFNAMEHGVNRKAKTLFEACLDFLSGKHTSLWSGDVLNIAVGLQAVCHTALGKIATRYGDPREACSHHQKAQDIFSYRGSLTPVQHLIENDMAWLRALAACKDVPTYPQRRVIYDRLIPLLHKEKRLSISAWLLTFLGPVGVWLTRA